MIVYAGGRRLIPGSHPRPNLAPILPFRLSRTGLLVSVEVVADAQPEHPALAVYNSIIKIHIFYSKSFIIITPPLSSIPCIPIVLTPRFQANTTDI